MSWRSGTTLWNATDFLTCERNRLGLLLACVEEAPGDDRVFAEVVKEVLRSRGLHAGERDIPLTRRLVERKAARYPSVAPQDVARIVAALGYDFGPEAWGSQAGAPAASRAAAKRAPRATSKTQRRHP